VEEQLQGQGAIIHAYEHDGLCFSLRRANLERLVADCSRACGYEVTIEPTKTFEQCVDLLRAKSGIDDWTSEDVNWEQREDLIVQARVAPLTQHGIFADLVCLEERISDECPFSIDQLFKQPTDDTHMTFYDNHLWKKDNVHGKSSMQPLIEAIILRTVQYYDANRWADVRDGKARGRFKAWGHMMRFRNVTFLKDVAEYIRIRLRCDRWELDPLSSDRYLNFDGGKTYDSLDDRWVDTHPDMRISLTTGWTYQGHLNGSPEQKTLKQRLVTAIQAVAEEHSRRPLDEPFVMSPELESEFDELAKEFAPLRLFYDWVQEWGVVMYLLQHLARATFAVKMAEALIVWSSGRSGKDTTVNMMETILGFYACTINHDALCGQKDSEGVCPQLDTTRAKRYIAVREIRKGKKIDTKTFNALCDPNSVYITRGLYKSATASRARGLLCICCNELPELTTVNRAAIERTAIIQYQSIYASTVAEAGTKIVDTDMRSKIDDMRSGIFWLLKEVFRQLLRGRNNMRNVLPRPMACSNVLRLGTETVEAVELKEAVAQYLQKATGWPLRVPQVHEIDKFLATMLNRSEQDIHVSLQGLHMIIQRRKSNGANVYSYQYNFTSNGKKDVIPCWVKISDEGMQRWRENGGPSSA
jgi:hypothetical protein